MLSALHFRDPQYAGLNEREWREALDFSDRGQLTLALRQTPARDAMPPWARDRTDGDAARNLERLRPLEDLYRCLHTALSGAGIEYLALKGLTHCPEFGCRPEDRVQYDIDLYTPKERIFAARDAVLALGFEDLEGMEDSPTDHIPALIRRTGWQWRGDFFDPEMPLAVELHFQFWNRQLERLPVAGVAEFWERRVTRMIADVPIPALCPADALGYASLHLLKHVLRGSGRPYHVYELARFLQRHAGDDDFWKGWLELHEPDLRRLEAVVFRLGQEWFGCELHPVAQEEMDRLPAATKAWFDEFAYSPITGLFHSSKDELWLHLSLLHSRRDAWAVARRRLLPTSLPGPVDAIHIPQSELTWRRRALKGLRYGAYISSRVRHHAVALPHVLRTGVRLLWKTNGLGSQFWTFLAAAALFNLALFIFVLLYNLYLLDLGFHEDFLGVVSGAGTAGCVAGTLPAAFVARRFGLRKTLLGAIGGAAGIAALRAVAVSQVPLTALAFVGGLIFAAWAVVMAPTVAGTVDARRRPTAFSVFFATMFAVGIAGGSIGGHLTVWVHGKQNALLLAAAFGATALWPAWRLAPTPLAPEGAKIYPRSSFLARYLFPFALWNLATGAFNPFFNAYFARLQFSVERIGAIFSLSQLTQVATVLLAPLVFRKAGLVNGIVWMMAAAALGLGGLATQPAGAGAVAAYIIYMTFQWMSEPGLTTLLMNHVAESERSGAAALNYLVAFSAQALAAFAAGALVVHFGYGVMLAGSAVLAVVAAGLFLVLLNKRAAR